MRDSTPPVVAVERLGRTFHVHADERTRRRHAFWALAARTPLGRRGAVTRRNRLVTAVDALRDVSFDVGRGECVGVIGANGSGKSTLLHIVCGTLAPTSGEVRTRGRVAALLELGTGFSPDLTGRENVRLSGLLHGLTDADVACREAAIAAFADIGAYLDQPVRTYSSGMYVRLAFSVMAHLDADLLVVDEALAVGDIRFVRKCLAHLERFRAGGGTLLFVSHDLPAVQRLCTRVLWLDGGRLRRDGPPREVTEAYFDAMIGSPPDDEAEARAADETDAEAGRPTPAPTAAGATAGHAVVAAGGSGARLTDVQLVDARGRPVLSVRGGERVTLRVDVDRGQALLRPVVGFYVKDRFGQQLFGENTFAATAPPAGAASCRLRAHFTFVMPRLYPGQYLVAVAVADGTQADHVHHEWQHEAWQFTSTWPGEATGLVGIDVEPSWIVVDGGTVRSG